MSKMGSAVQQPSLQPRAGLTIDARQRKIIDEQTKKLSDLRESQLTWASIEPIYVDYYRSALSQTDVDNMLAVFETPSAQEAVMKLQAATLSSILSMQGRMGAVIIQEQQIIRTTRDLLNAHGKANGPAPASSASDVGSDGR